MTPSQEERLNTVLEAICRSMPMLVPQLSDEQLERMKSHINDEVRARKRKNSPSGHKPLHH